MHFHGGKLTRGITLNVPLTSAAMDTNLLIRTLVLGKGWVQACVGGGIVADSDPQREYEETWHKAIGIVRALRP